MMNQALTTVVVSLLLTLPGLSLANVRASQPENEEQYALDAADANQRVEHIDEQLEQDAHPPVGPVAPNAAHAMSLAGTGWHHHHHNAAPAPAYAVAAAPGGVEHDAKHAKEAAKVAKQAAKVANDVAEHSIKITGHAKKALKHALGALHDARVDSAGLDHQQKHSLKKAEAHLREATKTAEHGKLKKFKDEHDLEKEKMQAKLDKHEAGHSEKEELLEEVHDLRHKLKGKKHDKDLAKALKELKEDIKESDGSNYDEIKAEVERMREVVEKLEDKEEEHDEEKHEHDEETHHGKSLSKDMGMEPLRKGTRTNKDVTPVEDKSIDIDTQMPYGELEPFGREDTAQELTERSITESDKMVDQLERAEVSEEKRAVFRALTRLRGAAITSYDGVARSQSGNIDEYNKVHKWRKAHPLHHLADEESDVQKWAFPDNADFLQTKKKAPIAAPRA